MQPRAMLPAKARKLLSAQHGVITTAQLVACSVTRRTIDRLSGGWQRLSPGIYLTGAPSFDAAVSAGLIRGGPDAVVGGMAACFLEKAVRDAPKTVLIWAAERRTGFPVGDWAVEFRRGTPSRFGELEPPRTRIHRSLLDVATTHGELDTVATITSAFAKRVASQGRLLTELRKRGKQRHRATIEALCDPASKGVHSLIEWVFLRDVIRAHRLPEPDLQVSKSAGRVDGHFRQYRTIVELDGKRDHAVWSRDMRRDNEHLLEDGSVTLRYGLTNILEQPCEAAAQVARRFRGQGWPGTPATCRRCRAAS